MFQASRQLFHRSADVNPADSVVPLKPGDARRPIDRHPAMRGLDVSPVHGHHCICGRCESRQSKDAA